MEWWQQLMLVIGGGLISGGAAVLTVLITTSRQLRLQGQERQQTRRDKLMDRRHEAYREYLRWLAQMPQDVTKASEQIPPDERRTRAMLAQAVLADLLLYGSPEVKSKAEEVRKLTSQVHREHLVKLAEMSQEVKAGKWDHVKAKEVAAFADMWFPALYWEKVWPVAQQLAELMAEELLKEIAPSTPN